MITKKQFNKYFGIGMIALCVVIMVLLISTSVKNGINGCIPNPPLIQILMSIMVLLFLLQFLIIRMPEILQEPKMPKYLKQIIFIIISTISIIMIWYAIVILLYQII